MPGWADELAHGGSEERRLFGADGHSNGRSAHPLDACFWPLPARVGNGQICVALEYINVGIMGSRATVTKS